MGIRRLSDLATTKAFYQVDDVDLLRANTDNTWPITARYYQELAVSKGNILLDVGGSSNIALSMPYHFDLGPNIFWTENNLNGQVNASDFARKPDPANTAIITNAYGRGAFTANIELRQPDSNLDVFAVNVYSNSDLIENTGTIRKTSKGNFDVVVYSSTPGTFGSLNFTLPYAANLTILCIGPGGNGGQQGLAGGGAAGGLAYVNNIQLAANTGMSIQIGGGGSQGSSSVTFGNQFTNQSAFISAGNGNNGLDSAYTSPPVTQYTGSNVGYNYNYWLGYFFRTGLGGGIITPYSTLANPISFESVAGSSTNYVLYSYFDNVTGQYSFTQGGGAGGYGNTSPYGQQFGGITNLNAPRDADTTRYSWHPSNVTIDFFGFSESRYWGAAALSNDGGGAGGVWRASSVFDAGKYSGFGTGIYGWDGVTKTQTAYVNNPGTYPNWNKPNVETLYGGYGAVLEGNMHPSFKTTTPEFGAGGAPGGTGLFTTIVPGGTGGPGVIRILFDGDKRKFPNINCGLELQTATMLWDAGSSTATWYNGEVVDPDNPYPNVLTWNFSFS
jgi:hypothetical protein